MAIAGGSHLPSLCSNSPIRVWRAATWPSRCSTLRSKTSRLKGDIANFCNFRPCAPSLYPSLHDELGISVPGLGGVLDEAELKGVTDLDDAVLDTNLGLEAKLSADFGK